VQRIVAERDVLFADDGDRPLARVVEECEPAPLRLLPARSLDADAEAPELVECPLPRLVLAEGGEERGPA
jgi:hypothetical protein